MAKELSEAGMKVVVLESGPYRDPQHDFASDELAMQRLGWQDTRVVDGSDPLEMGHNNSGWGVGGGTTHFTGVFLRFHESDFQTRTLDGVGEDWPIRYADLEPYYEKIERDIAVSGPKYFPWGPFRGPYPYPERDPISRMRKCLPAAARSWASAGRSRRSRFYPHRLKTGRPASTAGFAIKAVCRTPNSAR